MYADGSETQAGGPVTYGGHATQMLWTDTERLGCARATCEDSNGTPYTYVTCNYDPP